MKRSKAILSILCMLALTILFSVSSSKIGLILPINQAAADEDDYCMMCITCKDRDYAASCCIGIDFCVSLVERGTVVCDGDLFGCNGLM